MSAGIFGPLLEISRSPITAVGLPLTLGIGSGLVTRTSIDTWYQDLKKPRFEPPRKLFPIAWTLLYAGMGYASHLLVLAHDTSPRQSIRDSSSLALKLYYASLGLNLAWTPLFFGYKRVRLALADIGLLTGVVGALTVASFKVDKTAGFIYSAYLAWLGFATYLNAGVWYLNDKPSGDERGGSKDIPKAK